MLELQGCAGMSPDKVQSTYAIAAWGKGARLGWAISRPVIVLSKLENEVDFIQYQRVPMAELCTYSVME